MTNLIILSLVIITLYIFIKNGRLIRFINRISRVLNIYLYKHSRPLKDGMNSLDNSKRRIYIIVIFIASLLLMVGAVYLQTNNKVNSIPSAEESHDIAIDSINNLIDKHF